MAIKSLSVRIDSELLDRFRAVASYEARSINSQLLILIRVCVEEFEKLHGQIDIQRRRDR